MHNFQKQPESEKKEERIRRAAKDVFVERCQEMMTVKDMENTATPDPAAFFPAIGTNLIGSARRRLHLYSEQFPDSAIARGRAKNDNEIRLPKTALISSDLSPFSQALFINKHGDTNIGISIRFVKLLYFKSKSWFWFQFVEWFQFAEDVPVLFVKGYRRKQLESPKVC